MLGSSNLANRKAINRYFKIFNTNSSNIESTLNIEALVKSCASLKKQKTGALIVLERNSSLDFLKSSGVEVNMEVSIPVIESIFHKSAPLHDGAAIVENNNITTTRVVLPISNKDGLPKNFGLRHKAAVGITEKTDAVVLVVSEETGNISYFKDGEKISYDSYKNLQEIIANDMA
jgi:DNA integrity scanning protein DisA with diadenylate cyclase activity